MLPELLQLHYKAPCRTKASRWHYPLFCDKKSKKNLTTEEVLLLSHPVPMHIFGGGMIQLVYVHREETTHAAESV